MRVAVLPLQIELLDPHGKRGDVSDQQEHHYCSEQKRNHGSADSFQGDTSYTAAISPLLQNITKSALLLLKKGGCCHQLKAPTPPFLFVLQFYQIFFRAADSRRVPPLVLAHGSRASIRDSHKARYRPFARGESCLSVAHRWCE